jgi:hypothetical protein
MKMGEKAGKTGEFAAQRAGMRQPGPEGEGCWRIWVDTRQKIISFHEAEGAELMEFRSYELFLSCLDAYAAQFYRYQ